MDDKIKNLYKTFVDEGYDMEDEQTFRQNLQDPTKRKAAYDALLEEGYGMEPFDEFEKNIGYGMHEEEPDAEMQAALQAGASVGGALGKAVAGQDVGQRQQYGGVDLPRAQKPTPQPSQRPAAQAEQGERPAVDASQRILDHMNNPSADAKERERDFAEDKARAMIERERYEEELERHKPSQQAYQFVPEASNVRMGTPSEEALERWPWLKRGEVVAWNTATGEPFRTYTDSEGNALSVGEAAIQNAKAQITGDESQKARKAGAVLELPDATVSAIRTVKGSLDKRADEYLSKEYGEGYADKEYTDQDGNVMTGAELRDLYKQGLYDTLRESVKAAHIAIASGSVNPDEVKGQMQAQWGDVVGKENLDRYLSDEQATKRDLHDYAKEKLERAYAERNLIREQMDERGKELDSVASPYVDQWNDNPRERDGKYMELRVNLDAVENKIKSWEAVRDADDIGVARALKNTLFDPKTWDFGKSDFERSLAALTSRGEGRDRLAERIGEEDEAAKFEDENTGNTYRWMKIAGQSAPYMADFTGGAGLIKAISKGGAKVATKIAEKMALKGLGKTIVKNLGVLAGDVGAAYGLATTVQGLKTAGDIMERKAGRNKSGMVTKDESTGRTYFNADISPVSWGEAIYKGATAAAIDNYSEMVSKHLHIGKYIVKKLFPKIGLGKVTEALMKVGRSDLYKAASRWIEKCGIGEVPEEMLEEELSIPLNAALVGDSEMDDLLDVRQQLDIIGGIGLSVGAMKAAALTVGGIDNTRIQAMYMMDEHKLDKAEDGVVEVLGSDKWMEIKKTLDETTNDKLAESLEKIAKDKDLDTEQKEAIGKYAMRLLVMRGHNLGVNASIMANEQPQRLSGMEAENAMRSIFERGTTDILPEEVTDYEKVFSSPIRTILGEVVKIGKGVYNKIVRKERSNISGAIRPTLENADFVVNDTDGSRIYVKMFNKPDGSKTYNVAVVSKTGELEDYISSVHIKSINNLLNKIKNGAELSLPSKRTSYGDETPNSAATFSGGKDTTNSPSTQGNGTEMSQYLHEDGTLHKARIYPQASEGKDAEGHDVFIVKGDLALREDGTVDKEASSDMIVYVGADGERHVAPASMFESAETPQAPHVGGAGSPQVGDGAAPQFYMDDEVKVAGADGNTYNGYVSGVSDNEVTVDYEDADGDMKRVTLPYDELARMNGYDVENEANTPMAENNSALQTPTEAVANGDETNGESEIQPVGKGVFGNIYNQFKGKVKDAINFLTRKKEGVAIGALHHKDIGDIDLVWGNKDMGLEHILAKHQDILEGIQDKIDEMAIVKASDNRIILESDTHKAIISKDWFGERTNEWLLTAYEKKDKNASAGSIDINAELESKQNGTAPLQGVLSAGKDTQNSDVAQGNGEKLSPMPMVKDRQGNDTDEPDFMQATPQRAHTYLYNEADLSRKEADGFVKANVDAAQKQLDKVKKKEPKMGTSISAYKAAKAAIADELAEAQRQVDYWNKVKAEQDKVVIAEMAARAEKDKARHDAAVEEERQRKEAEAQAAAEREAVGNENPMPQITEKWNTAPKVDGVADEIVLPNGEKVKGHYVLTESGAATPSHQSTNGFQKSEGFPMDENGNTVNDRDYERDTDAQGVTRNIAAQYDSRALQTPVVVSQDGVVLSGNGRTMAGELAAHDNTDTAYNEYLKQYAQKYGFSPEQVAGMQHPRVVFVPDERMPYTADTFSKFNQQEMKSQSKTEQAVKLGKIVDDNTFNRIVRTINAFDTLGDFYNDPKAANEAIKELQAAGIINQQQLAEMYDGDGISAVGREMLENTLIGKAFESNPDAVRMITEFKSMRQSVITALSEIANNIALGEDFSLEQELSEAVKLCYNARHDGYKHGEQVSNFARQGVLFGEEGETIADYHNVTIMMLADLLNDVRSTQLKKTLAVYNDQAHDSASGQMDIFSGGVKSKEDLLKDVLKILNYGTREQQQAAVAEAIERRKESVREDGDVEQGNQGNGETETSSDDGRGSVEQLAERQTGVPQTEEVDENGRPFVKAADGTTVFGEIREDSGLTPAPIKLSEGYQDEDGKGYGLAHIEANHGEQIRNAGFASVEDFVAYVAQNYDEDNIRVGKRRDNGSPTYLIQITDTHDNTLFIEMSKDGTCWNVNSAGIFRKGYSNKKETVAKTEPQQPNNAVSTGSSLSKDEEGGITSSEPNGEPTVSADKVTESSASGQENEGKTANRESKGNKDFKEGAKQEQPKPREGESPIEYAKRVAEWKEVKEVIDAGVAHSEDFDRLKQDIKDEMAAKQKVLDDAEAAGQSLISDEVITAEKESDKRLSELYAAYRAKHGEGGRMADYRKAAQDTFDKYYKEAKANLEKQDIEKSLREVDDRLLRGNIEIWENAEESADAFVDRDVARFISNAYKEPSIKSGLTESLISDEAILKAKRDVLLERAKAELARREGKEYKPTDAQGNPIDKDGKLITEKVGSVDELTDEDFTSPKRSVELPKIPDNLDKAIGANGKPVIIKRNIFEKNNATHKFTPSESRRILQSALYNPDIVGQSQPTKRKSHWVAIKIDDKSPITVLEVNENKENVEVVGWYTLDKRNLERIKRQAEREGGELLILTPKGAAASLSTLPHDLSSDGKGTQKGVSVKENGENSSFDKIDDWGEEIKGARKNAMKEVARGIEQVDERELVEKPLSQVWKRPDYAKLVAKGETTEKDARVLEAISRAMAAETKPRITGRAGSWKRRGQEEELGKWIERIKEALQKVKAYAEGTEEQRAAIEKELREGYDAASVMYAVLENIGYPNVKAGRFSLPEIKERKPFSGDRVTTAYTVDGTVFNSVEEAKAEAVRRVRVGLGYDDIAYTERDFAVGYTRKAEEKKTGKWLVEYNRGRSSLAINSRPFETKEQAEEYAQNRRDAGYTIYDVREEVISEYVPDKYVIFVRDPYTRQHVRLEGFDYDSEEEAKDAVSSNIEELGHKANEIISKIHSEENKTTLADRLKFHKDFDRKSKTYTLSVDMGGKEMPVVSGLKYGEIQDYIEKNRGRIAKEVEEARKKTRSGAEFKPATPRKGKDWRKGKDITAEEFGRTFGFRGVQFGNWANQADRQQALNECYDALMDMADVLGVSPRALSLGGELGMAFGARGTGNAMAHYEPHEVVINLTKTKGAGSLAHEWWHALDNYFGRRGWNAHAMITERAKERTQDVRDEVLQAYLDITNAVNNSDYAKRNADSKYWGSMVEETARAFAEFVKGKVEAKGEHNDFLAQGIVSAEDWRRGMYAIYRVFCTDEKPMTFEEFKKKPIALNGYRYPTPEELKEIITVR